MFSFAEIPGAIQTIVTFVGSNVILCSIILFSYVLFYVYQFIHSSGVDSDVYEIDLLSAGVSSLTTAFLLVGLDESSNSFTFTNLNLSEPSTMMAIGLSIYSLVLILFAFTKILPKFLVVMLGNSELDLFINLVAVMIISPGVKITPTLLAVIGVPLVILLIIQRVKRMMH
jgi:hypothetical protein